MIRFWRAFMRRFFTVWAEEGEKVSSLFGKGLMNPVGQKFERHTYLAIVRRK